MVFQTESVEINKSSSLWRGSTAMTLDPDSGFESWLCHLLGFPGSSGVKNFPAMQETWVGKIPWRRAWQPTPVFLPEESHGWRSLEGCSPWGCKESEEFFFPLLLTSCVTLVKSFNLPGPQFPHLHKNKSNSSTHHKVVMRIKWLKICKILRLQSMTWTL